MKNKILITVAIAFLVVVSLKLIVMGNRLQTLHGDHISQLFYEPIDVPRNINEIVKGFIGTDSLADFYKNETDDMVKFNVVAIINMKFDNHQFLSGDEGIYKIVDSAIIDQNPWIRAEVVDVAGKCDFKKYKDRIAELVLDKSLVVSFSAYLCANENFPLSEFSALEDKLDEEKKDRFLKLSDPTAGKIGLNKIASEELLAYKVKK